MTKLKKFMLNGLLITTVSFLIRGISVGFNIYLSNTVGAVAMGVFTLVTTVYGFALTVATSGIGLATIKHIAEAVGEASRSNVPPCKSPAVRCVLQKCVRYALVFSMGSALILYILSPYIGKSILCDVRTISSLRVLALSLPPIALSSVYSGYFIAVRRVYKNAIVTTLGQGIKIFSCICLLYILGSKDVENACLSIVIGSTLSEILSFLIQYLFYILERSSISGGTLSKAEQTSARNKILRTALPVAFSAYARSALITIEHILIPKGLEKSGSSKDSSLSAYGTIHSMVFPLVLFPSALSSSFAGLLVPEIAESKTLGDTKRILRIVHKVFFASLTFSICVAGIMTFFSYELSNTIYPTANAGKYVLMIAPLIPVMYIDTSTDGILKGLGEQVYCMGVNIADALLSVILVWLLLPQMGIGGYILTVYFTEIVNAALSISRLFTITRIKPKLFLWVIYPIASIVLSCSVIRVIATCFTGDINNEMILVAYIALTVLLYLATLYTLINVTNKLKKAFS